MNVKSRRATDKEIVEALAKGYGIADDGRSPHDVLVDAVVNAMSCVPAPEARFTVMIDFGYGKPVVKLDLDALVGAVVKTECVQVDYAWDKYVPGAVKP